jgi:glycine/D-amino acid oxidase-like deaminating enzyme
LVGDFGVAAIFNDNRHDVAVIGAGVFGAWTAYMLQRSGRQVVLIDGHGAGNSRSSSGDESRIMRMGYGADEIYSRSAQHSLELWQKLAAETGETLFHQAGVLWLAGEDDPYPGKSYETLTKLGIPVRRLEVDEARMRFPQLNFEGIGWAMLEPESGAMMARRAVQAVVIAALKRGVKFVEETIKPPVNGNRLNEIVTGSGGRISADTFVFACGAWLPKVFPDLLGERIHPSRQEVFYFESDEKFSPPNLPVWIDFSNEAYGLPNLEGHGVKVAIDRHGPSFDPETGDRHTSAEGLAEARAYLASRLPALRDAPLRESRVCQYENTSNGDFLLDRHPDFENVWLVGGGSGHGFKHGPFVGAYVADRIEGKSEGIEPRFSLATKTREQKRAVY